MRTGLAHVLGMSPAGGAFGARLGSLRMWGIIEGRSVLRLTQAASNALAETDDAARALFMSDLVGSVPFFVELSDRMPPGNLDRAVLAATVQQITEAPMNEVDARLPQIERLLGEARQHMKPSGPDPSTAPVAESGIPEVSRVARQAVPAEVGGISADRMELRYPGAELSVEETSDNIDLLMAALTARKRRLELGGVDDVPPTNW